MRQPLIGGSVLLLLFIPAEAAEWRETQTAITTGGGNPNLGVSGKNLAVDGFDRVHLLYQTSLADGSLQILYTRRDPDGAWSRAEVVSPPGQSARNASLAIDQDNRLHAFWEDASHGDGDIVHRQCEADGAWGAPEYISPTPGASTHVVAAVDAENRIHVVWVDEPDGVRQILHSSLDAEGTEWDSVLSLSVGGRQPGEPSISADSQGSVHVVWSDLGFLLGHDTISFNIYYLRLDPGTLGDPAPVSITNSFGGYARRPYLAALPDGSQHLVWLDNRGATGVEIFYKRLLPGIGWGKDKRFTYDLMDHGHPMIVAGPGNTLNLAWEKYESFAPDIFYRQITRETGWDPLPTQLTNDVSASQSPILAALSTGEMFLVWSDSQGIKVKEGHVTRLP